MAVCGVLLCSVILCYTEYVMRLFYYICTAKPFGCFMQADDKFRRDDGEAMARR